jgi:hypothetical protein
VLRAMNGQQDRTRDHRRARVGDFVCGTLCGAITGYLLVGAIVVLATGHLLEFVPALPMQEEPRAGRIAVVTVRLLHAAYYAVLGCLAFIVCRFGQEVQRGLRWRDALAEAKRLPRLW